ncbi:MAG: hypothetical protein JWM28_2801 [Chitinophagaceae bacterium]|nr:hypothetical protein [Chitinophagaceae bacterium]
MILIYFKTAWRNLKNHKSASLLNITGLSLGMAAAVLIMLWVQNELNFDNYHSDADRIYLVTVKQKMDTRKFGGTPLVLAEAAKQQIPEIETTCRLVIANNATTPVLGINNNLYKEKDLAFVDKEWFSVFHYDFIAGSAEGFSQKPTGIILTESLARKYYIKNNGVGQIVHIDSNIYQVQAIVKDNPANSSFQFNIFLPIEAYLKNDPITPGSWSSFKDQTFIKTKTNANAKTVEKKITNILQQQDFIRQMFKDTLKAGLTTLPDMHFDDSIDGSFGLQSGDKKVVLIFSILGFLLLAIACINYVNLTTAKASQRSKEVSIKKIMGAGRKSLFVQFMAESLLTGTVALVLTLFIVWLSLPWFNSFTEKNFVLSLSSVEVGKIMAGTLIVTVLFTGIYPALLLSSFKPLNVLKGVNILKVKNTSLRKILVTSQFTIAIALIICTLVILKQLFFIQANNEGYNRSQIFSISLPPTWPKYHNKADKSGFLKILKNELSGETAIENITVSNDAIQNLKMSWGGGIDWNGRLKTEDRLFTPLSVDADFTKIFKLELKEGRWFQENNLDDRHNYILNETAISELGLKKPYIGQFFAVFGDTGRIIGIAKDFHFRDFHQKIGVSVLLNNPELKGTFFIQATASRMKQALARAEMTWKKFFPQEPFEYNFMDEEFEQMYKSDMKTSKLVGIFSGIAIFISCLGLFGLVSFVAEQKTKEIGIRKVLGATVANITTLLSKDFIKLVIIAFIMASPIAWWAMNKWLEAFAYRINISWWIFVSAGAAAIFIALLTVSSQAVKAAMANPAKSLRSE